MAESDGAAQVFKEIRVDFGDFAKMFDNYATKLTETEEIWRNISNIWKTMTPIGSSTNASETTPKDNAFRELSTRNMREQIKYFKSFPEYTKSFNLLRGELVAMTAVFGRMTGLGKIFGAGTVVEAAAGMAATIAGQAIAFRGTQAQAQAYGTTPEQKAAFDNMMKMFTGGEGGTERLFGGLVQQETRLGGPTFLRNWLRRYGVTRTAKTQEELAEDVLRAERKMALTTDPSRWQAWIKTFQIGDVADIGTMMRFRTRGTTAGELEEQIKKGQEEARKLRLAPEQKKAEEQAGETVTDWWLRFQAWLKMFGANIINITPQLPGDIKRTRIIRHGTYGEHIKEWWGKQHWWKDFKELFGVSPAKAGELPPGLSPTGLMPPGPMPVQDKALLDYLKQASLISTDSLIGDGLGGTGVPIGIRRRGSGRSYGVNTLWGGDKGTGGLTFAASLNMSPEDRALLDVLALRESGSKSYLSGDPDFGAAFQGNRYQFLGATWAQNAKEIGANVNDLSPENQDRIALHLAKKLIGNRWEEAVRNPSILRSILGPTWHGVWNEDTGVTFQKALEGERLRKKISDESKPVPKARFHITDPNPDPLTSHQYPAKGEKTSMNDLSNFQGAWPRNHIALNVYNQAGGNFLVQSAMLGSGSGSFRPS